VEQALSRADGDIVMYATAPDLQGYRGPVLQARLTVSGGTLTGRRVFAFAGIGRPEKFLASLNEAGAIVTGAQFFGDHHPYRPEEIAALRGRAGGATLVTTEKDFVRLNPQTRADIAVLPVEARFENPAALDTLLARIA
jgi:tetraacyldisaccharide 4'-kinase